MQCQDWDPIHDSLVHTRYCWHFYMYLLNSPGLFAGMYVSLYPLKYISYVLDKYFFKKIDCN